jgi:hypothetical protein
MLRGGVNDDGAWAVECESCAKRFAVPVKNPEYSKPNVGWRHEPIEWPCPELVPLTECVEHSSPRRWTNWQFSLGAAALYTCARSGDPLEEAAYAVIKEDRRALDQTWHNLEQYLAGSATASDDRILLICDVPCQCGQQHIAVFYAPTLIKKSHALPMDERCLLAHISGTDLEDRLSCILSKSDAMDLLEKLLIRWQLTCRAIVVASPFVGYQRLKPEARQSLWDWLLANLDPEKAMLLTRGGTWKEFKGLQDAAGMKFEELERYGLVSPLVGKGKHDFHAKFFAGVAPEATEVASGSANLVRGPSFENLAFQRMSEQRFQRRYIDVLKQQLPVGNDRRPKWVLTKTHDGSWAGKNVKPSIWKFIAGDEAAALT